MVFQINQSKPEFVFTRRPTFREREINTFRCPECKIEVRPVNVQCITCPNCAYSGTKEHFSAIERAA